MSHNKQHGFTLMELMITVTIISIIAGVAYPTYRDNLIQARRSDAMIALTEIAQLQERFFSEKNVRA